ncbi:MAG: glycosyl transferase group 1 [Candidatus Peregrinibacteria bacterium GW2011_GWE2_39_6]|nr:MAG: glycosyl transferase group 1 [Candidatus Peregrinibacteria bacterium GW2011_GWF2_39_17]KKR23369.1 MAG: glycosyl transferase group 1 [Candidatus Peregrinibacteria bacterium GW2011_GWE2_39_6]HCW32892.1 glycosyltransferase family 4 protein [Candidatus Peregrinibacteria bacterium]
MKIALVHDFILKLGGAERVLKVLSDLFPHAPIYTLLYNESRTGQILPASRIRTSTLQKLPHFIRNHHRYLFPWMPKAIESFDFSGYDLVISSSSAYAHGIITNSHTKHLCYCHSPMRYAWDWTNEYLRELKLNPLKRHLIGKLLKKIRIWDFYAADRVDQYLANSKHVQNRLAKYYRKPSKIIYPPVDIDRFTVTPHHENYFLIVSTLTRYKNIERAIQLFNKVRKRLVIIGEGPDCQRLKQMAGPQIDFLGFKPDEVVKEYLENCRAFIFPGEEDFGIAPVEAMACGKPVLAYNKGGVKESVIPGITGEFFDEPTISSMEDGLARLLANTKQYDPALIRKQAEKFSKEHFEMEIRKLLRDYY